LKREAGIAALCAAVVTALYLGPFWRRWDWPGARDWAIWAFYEVTAQKAVLDHGQFPLWNPYACGGEPYHAHPFTRALAPLSPLHWLAGHPSATLRIEATLLVAATAWLAYLLARRSGLSRGGAALAAVLTAFGGTVVGRLWAGHLGLLQLPWVLLALLARSIEPERRAVASGGLAIALLVLAAGNYLAVCAAVLLGLEAAWDVAKRRRAGPLIVSVGMVALGFALAGIKIVPTLDFLADYPRLTGGKDPFAWGGPLRALISPLGFSADVRGAPFGWHEYAAYVGWLPLLLALAALVLDRRRAARPAVMSLAFVLVAWGDFAPWAPWSLLHRLPVIDSMRIPARFLLVAMIPLGMLAGLGLDACARILPARAAPLAVLAVPVVLLDLALEARPALGTVFVRPSPPSYLRGVPRDGQFHQIRGTSAQMADAAEHDLGTVRCAEGVPIRRSQRLRTPTQRGYRGEAWIMGDEAGNARIARFSPNDLDIDVHVVARQGATLVLNQNFDRRWRAATGEPIRDFEGVLSVPLPPGTRSIRLVYRPASLAWGAALTALALVPLAWGLRRRRPPSPDGRAPPTSRRINPAPTP
jgi:hypothetical protein